MRSGEGALGERVAVERRDAGTLGEERVGVGLRDDGLEHLAAGAWVDLLVHLHHLQLLVRGGEVLNLLERGGGGGVGRGDGLIGGGMQETMSARREGSDCVSRPRPWSAMRRRRSAFAAGSLVGNSPRKKAAAEGGLDARRWRARGIGAGDGGAKVLFGTKRSGAIGREKIWLGWPWRLEEQASLALRGELGRVIKLMGLFFCLGGLHSVSSLPQARRLIEP
jgi:hypothetical protein